MVLNQLEQQLILHGYTKAIASQAGTAVYRRQYNGDWYLICMMQDTGRNLNRGEFHRIMEQEAEALYRQYNGGRIYPLGVVVSTDVAVSRKNCEGRFACWYVDALTGRLIIYEDQPGEFLDFRYLLESTLMRRDSAGNFQLQRKKRVKAFRLTPVNTLIVLANIICFIWLELLGDTTDGWFMYQHGAMLIQDMDEIGEWYRLFTSAFLHFGFSHLFNNMLVLMYLGDNLEKVLGWWKYLLFYLVSAVGSSAISCIWYWLDGNVWVVSAGASGAIFGVVGGLLYVVIRNHGRLEDIRGVQLVLLIIFTLYHGITSLAGGVNNSAHVGGLAVGILMAMLLYHKRMREEAYDRY